MAMLALRLDCLQTLCFLYRAQSLMYSDTATSCVMILTARLVLHFFASLRQDFIIFIMSLGSSKSSSRVNSVCVAAISGPWNGRDSCSDSSVRAGSAASASPAAIIAICISNISAMSIAYHRYPAPYIPPQVALLRYPYRHHPHPLCSVQLCRDRILLAGRSTDLWHHRSNYSSGPWQDSWPIARTLHMCHWLKHPGYAQEDLLPIVLIPPQHP